MSDKGWICIHRKLQDCWIWEKKPFSPGQAWIDMLMLANHEEKKVSVGYEVSVIETGEFLTSEASLSERWGWSRSKLRRFLICLINDSMIVKKTVNKKTVITIVNYEVYQNQRTDKKQKTNNDRTMTEQSQDLNNNYNNYNNENNIAISKDIVCSAELKQICEKWNELKELGIPDVSILTDKRRKMLVARIKQHGIEKIYQAMDEIKKSDYLQGKNKYNWIITFNWFVHPENFAKVLEGYYTKGSQSKGGYDLEFKRK